MRYITVTGHQVCGQGRCKEGKLLFNSVSTISLYSKGLSITNFKGVAEWLVL